MKLKFSTMKLISVLLIIMLSNTMYFGLINRKKTLIVYVILSLIILLINKKINKKNFIIILSFFSIMIITIFMNFEIIDKTYFINQIQLLVIVSTTMIFISNQSSDEFCQKYTNIMFFLAILSLIFCFIANYIPSISHYLYNNSVYGNRIYKVSPFYTWGWDNLFSRNSGPFWEPGAYQGFLNLALLMTIINKNIIKLYKQKFIIFLITILTTQSTTGYIVLVIILIVFNREIFQVNIKKDYISKIIILLFIIIGILIVFKSGNITDKFSINNGSKIIRSSDFINSLKMCFSRVIRGFGVGLFKNNQEFLFNIQNNSNGLLYLFYSQGIILFLYYMYRIKIGIKQVFFRTNKFKQNILFIIFLVLYFTEGLAWLPVYVSFLFYFKTEV